MGTITPTKLLGHYNLSNLIPMEPHGLTPVGYQLAGFACGYTAASVRFVGFYHGEAVFSNLNRINSRKHERRRMKRTMDYNDLYKKIQKDNLTSHVLQWNSLASTAQYQIPYKITGRYLNRPATVLDWGCGNGHFSYFLTANGFTTTGYSFENPPPFLEKHPSFTHKRGEEKDPKGIPFQDKSFDGIFSVGVLEHVHEGGGDQKASLREIDRILKPGGLFFCFHLPNSGTWVEFIIRIVNKLFRMGLHTHTRLFRKDSFKALLEGTSLEVVRCGRYNFFPRNILNKLPPTLNSSPLFVSAFNMLDSLAGFLLPFLSQNWFFVVWKKPDR